MIYGEMLWVPGFFLVAQRRLRGMGLTVDFNYLKDSYKDSGTKLLVAIVFNSLYRRMVLLRYL